MDQQAVSVKKNECRPVTDWSILVTWSQVLVSEWLVN